MNVLFVLGIGFDSEGPSVHLMEGIIKATIAHNHTVRIVSRNTGGAITDKFNTPEYGGTVINYEIGGQKVNKRNFLLRYYFEIQYAFAASKIYREFHDIDVVFLQSTTVSYYHTKLLNRYIQKPILYNVQDIFPDNLHAIGSFSATNPVYRFLKGMQSKGYANADIVVTISEDMRQTLISDGVDGNKIKYVYNWSYDDSAIEILDEQNLFGKRYQLKKEKLTVIYAGNIGKMQNIDVIIEAAKTLSDHDDVEFIIVGDGNVDRYKEEVGKNKLCNVLFFPMQPSEMAEHVYAYADVILIPLHDGVIRTALPSKTATCLRLNKKIIFCIDENAIFAKKVSIYDNVFVCGCTDSKKLGDILVSLSENRQSHCNNARDFVETHMSCFKNPCRYVAYLEKIAEMDNSEKKYYHNNII